MKKMSGFAMKRAAAAAALAMMTGTAHSAELAPPPALGASCVEVIPAQPGAAPAILLDRCSGQTWQLVRSYAGRHGVRYAWHPLLRQEAAAAPQKASAVAAPARPKAPAAGNSKCFSFNGRTFCE
jgi:hypothetical protein